MASNTLPQPPDAARIGAFLKAARETHNQRVEKGQRLAPTETADTLSQEQAAARVNSTTRTMGGWERGETVPPTDQFLALVYLYGADILQLLAIRSTKADVAGARGEGGQGRTRKLG
jgi:transcriptional regulator with XRE-family HTH domain